MPQYLPRHDVAFGYNRRMRIGRKLKWIVLGGLGLVFAYAAWIGVSLLFLPSVNMLKNPRASFTITVRDWNRKEHPFVVGPRNRDWTPVSSVPAALKRAVIAAEDAKFYSHEGVDVEALKDALKTDIRKGRFVRGGSTITQQVAKNIFLSREKTISRKVKEIILARRIDDVLSKSRILELYLNVAELGPMVYGIGRASRYYFGKSPQALTVRECAFFAAMLPRPKVYNPYRKMNRVMRRTDRILKRMYAARMITEEECRQALSEDINLAGIERKVERTMAAPPPQDPGPPPAAEWPVPIPEPGPPAPGGPEEKPPPGVR